MMKMIKDDNDNMIIIIITIKMMKITHLKSERSHRLSLFTQMRNAAAFIHTFFLFAYDVFYVIIYSPRLKTSTHKCSVRTSSTVQIAHSPACDIVWQLAPVQPLPPICCTHYEGGSSSSSISLAAILNPPPPSPLFLSCCVCVYFPP